MPNTESLSLWTTDRRTDRQTNRHDKNNIPRSVDAGHKLALYTFMYLKKLKDS